MTKDSVSKGRGSMTVAEAGKKGGQAEGGDKAAAARANGQKGGRPTGGDKK